MKLPSWWILMGMGACLSASAVVNVHHTSSATHYDVDVEGVEQTSVDIESHSFVRARLKGVQGYEGIEYKQGYPEIPAVRLRVEGEGEVFVEADPFGELVSVREKVAPSLPPVPRLKGSKRTLSLANSAYALPAYPELRYEISEVGSQNGVRVRLVSLYPVEYLPQSDFFRFYRRFHVTHLKDHVARRESAREGLLFVVGKPFADSKALKKYVAFKESLGFDVSVAIIERNDPDTIRKFVKTWRALQTGKRNYVLVVGDHATVAGYESPRVSGVTDHYYRAVDTNNYETDIGTPDLSLGRFSIATEAELQTVVDNSIRYASGSFKDDSWLARASLIATDDTSWFEVAENTMDYLFDKYTGPFGFLGTFPKALKGGDKLYAIAHDAIGEDVLKAINEGRGFVTYGGHGSTGEWSGPEITNEDLKKLTHPEATPYVTSHACYTGHFLEDSFAEAWQRHPMGSVMIWASSDVDFWDEGDILQRLLYDYIFQHRALDFGSINDATVADFWKMYKGEGKSQYYWETYLSFGDPSIAFRTGRVKPVSLKQTADKLSITEAYGKVVGARVALICEGTKSVQYTDAAGQVTLDSSLGKSGSSCRAVVSGADSLIVESKVTLP